MSYRTDRINHLRRDAEQKAKKRLRKQRAELHAALEHCHSKSKTRKRSVEKLMAERGWVRTADAGHVEDQWARV
jgi:hypothetical protein